MCSANVTAYRHPSIHTHTRSDIADSDRRLGLALVAIFQLHAVGLVANQCNSYTRSIAIHRLFSALPVCTMHMYYYLFLSTSIFIFIRSTNYGFNSGRFFHPILFRFCRHKKTKQNNNNNRQPVEYAKELKWTWNVVKMTNECNLFRCAAFDIYFSDARIDFFYFSFSITTWLSIFRVSDALVAIINSASWLSRCFECTHTNVTYEIHMQSL